ncbi:MAG: endolytic transglycosylase MltG, partial [Prevotella sp.]
LHLLSSEHEIYWDISPEKFLERMKREHDAFWTSSRRKNAIAIGMTPNEVATLASIIDEESSVNSEKPMIAGMYINRLHADMPLQADPTVKYALGDFSLRRIYRKHLLTPSPYNTYTNTGLPPGPIKIASTAAIDAVLNHTRHDYLYMCANADFSGTHIFARTYADHLANAARYSAALNERGIK